MECSSSVRSVVAFLILILAVTEISAQIRFPNENEEDNCPRGTRCERLSRCSRDALRAMRVRPIRCGYSYRYGPRICCPNQMPNAPRPGPPFRPQPETPRPQPVTPRPRLVTPRPRPVTPRPRPATVRPRPVDPQECGSLNGLQGFVVGGDVARQGAWPWLAAIAMRGRSGRFNSWCTGSLVTRRHVVSAAHCYDRREPSMYVARIGHVNQTAAQVYNISQIVVPETYVRGRFYDDITILTLSNDVNSENFVPICLPPSRDFEDFTGKGVTVAGWGSTEVGGQLSEVLMQLQNLPVMSNEVCNTELTARVTGFTNTFARGITDGLVCAAFMEGGKDTCAGDSGGPMMFLTGDQWYLVGVVSFGIPCAEPGFPAGYTRVTEYLDWIRSNIRN